MFNKKVCECGKKVSSKYDFCPYCGAQVLETVKSNSSRKKSEEQDSGMLGENDIMQAANEMKLPMGLNTIFKSLVKNLDKQMVQLNQEAAMQKNTQVKKRKMQNPMQGMSVTFAASNLAPEMLMNMLGGMPQEMMQQQGKQQKQTQQQGKPHKLSQEKMKLFSSLDKKEPKTNVRRFSDQVIYEMDIPEIKSIDDVSITKLEKSFEIKAVSKEAAYLKTLQVTLPLIRYGIGQGKLVLEFDARN